MPSFKTLLLPLALSLAATTTAATCSGDWLSNTFGGDQKCCYGNMMVIDKDAFCCVYDLTPPVETSSTSTAISSTDDYAGWSTAGECFTKVPFSASNYSDLVSSASSKIAAARATVASNTATSTSASASSSSASSGTSSTASGTGSKTSSGSAASTSNAAMPIATAHEMMLGGAAVVVGIFVL
ncbi:uncharacterized protein N7473_012271 [Penicillium subrubescens]|uniref:Extracellular membrane protein CFEM domain-containing protein n=1 Tax=Penicillium subrubescens TaxID=1316194 RepID=A0A1Q5UDV3_9EURO|nr:uncharacterized protein N7473_012271 [Penicillium subrubescens]KAJ5881218.1 hypothetical protein N7473_012271 [Penicillium subrubescens]OKP10661.1 hypothetical protein PENSUB_3964 [Penicillium subrubescens]